jgi:ribosomal protein L40E
VTIIGGIVMSEILSKIGKTISDTGKVVGEKTKQMTDLAKLNYKIGTLEQSLINSYIELGKEYYEENNENPSEKTAETVAEIKSTLSTITEIKAQINAIRGVNICQSCGAEMPLENDFCGKCGAKLVKPVIPDPVEEKEEVITEEIDDTVIDEDKKED